MHWSKDVIERFCEEKGFQAEGGFAERLLELVQEVLEEALEQARREGRKFVRISDLPETKGLLIRRALEVGPQRLEKSMREHVVLRRWFSEREAPLIERSSPKPDEGGEEDERNFSRDEGSSGWEA